MSVLLGAAIFATRLTAGCIMCVIEMQKSGTGERNNPVLTGRSGRDPIQYCRRLKRRVLYPKMSSARTVRTESPVSQRVQYHSTLPDLSRSKLAGSGSSVGCASARYSDGRGFDRPVRQNIILYRLVMKLFLLPFSPYLCFK